jgi:hypothetical protein
MSRCSFGPQLPDDADRHHAKIGVAAAAFIVASPVMEFGAQTPRNAGVAPPIRFVSMRIGQPQQECGTTA